MPKTARQLNLEISMALARPPAPKRTRNALRLEVAYPAELEQAGQHFASGCNHEGEIRGLTMSGRSFGITANQVSPALLKELEFVNGNGGPRLFVDSGAFSEVKFHDNGPPTVKKLITDAEWKKRLKLYEKLAAMYRVRCYLVAPDQVGNQAVTLERLARYAPQIAACAALRANIIVPVQKGPMPMSAFYKLACATLGLRDTPIAGVPMKKDATSIAQLAELVDSLPWTGARIHLLGLGPESKRFAKVIATIKHRRPNTEITSDSVTVRRLAGRKNGRKGGPRVLTRYQDEARASKWSAERYGGSLSAGGNVKAYALSKQGNDEMWRERQAALDAGWFDTELYDTIEEARAHAAAGYPDRD